MIEAVYVDIDKHINKEPSPKYVLKNITPRLYQETMLAGCVTSNCLVVLPTGMGKTVIALMLAAQRFKQYPQSKVVFLAPTKPLAEQHLATFKKHFVIDEDELVLFTGKVSPEKRAALWDNAKVIFSTPQGLENDVISERVSLNDVSLMIFDEAHRASGDYAYVFLAKQYQRKAQYPKILAMTASPGGDKEKIMEVCKNLHVEGVEIRTAKDPDVKPYVQELEVTWIGVDLPPEFLSIKKYLEASFRDKLRSMKSYGTINTAQLTNFGKMDLLRLQGKLHGMMAKGERDFSVLKSLSLTAEAIKVQHALELIETQGVSALQNYMGRLYKEAPSSKVKAVKNLTADLNFKSAFIKTQHLCEKGTVHPKLTKLKALVEKEVKQKSDVKIIIFTQYRDSAVKIKEVLGEIPAKIFVGQAKKGNTGLSQKEQQWMLAEFRDNVFNVLIATSVAEEGLDIPSVNLVLFYEPVPSAIRHIQRQGRTGRQEKGRVIGLMTNNTRDVGYRWSAHYKEQRMHRALAELRDKLTLPQQIPTLEKYLPKENIKIFADYREKGSGVIKELIELGASMRLESLPSADFLLSSRCGVEYKTKADFVSSIIDGRLLQQVKELKRNFERPLILVEGEEDIYAVRKVHPNAIRGMLAMITVSYGIPLVYTKNFKETAALLMMIARREQEEGKKEFGMHGSKKPMSLRDQQEYVVSSLPSVGPSLAKEMLQKFGSVSKVMSAQEEDLKQVDKVGDKIAQKIKEVLEKDY